MRVLVTGGSSPLGARVLGELLEVPDYTEVWGGIHDHDLAISDSRLKPIKLRLEEEFDLGEIPVPLDLVIHFAGVTHAEDERKYSDINFRGTMRLALSARARGCRDFVYISSRCATAGSGAYGESKLAAERGLLELDWNRLLILRPAEIYGGGGREGIDKLLALASRFHVVPFLWGHKELRFAPLTTSDFVTAVSALVQTSPEGVRVLDLCGPEDLKASTLAVRIARQYRALPIPIWWPCLVLGLRALRRLGFPVIVPDQLDRLVGKKTAYHSTPNAVLDKMMCRFLEV